MNGNCCQEKRVWIKLHHRLFSSSAVTAVSDLHVNQLKPITVARVFDGIKLNQSQSDTEIAERNNCPFLKKKKTTYFSDQLLRDKHRTLFLKRQSSRAFRWFIYISFKLLASGFSCRDFSPSLAFKPSALSCRWILSRDWTRRLYNREEKKDEREKKKISLTKFYGRAWCSTTSSRSSA